MSLNSATGAHLRRGLFAEGVLTLLDRESRPALFHEFFSPFASGKRIAE